MTLVSIDHGGTGDSALLPARARSPLPNPLRHPLDYYWRKRARRRALEVEAQCRQERAWEMQSVLANVHPDLCQYGYSVGCRTSGRNIYVPHVIDLDFGPPEVHTVRMLPGQTVADYEVHADTIAECFGVARVRMTRLTGRGYVEDRLLRIELLVTDPLNTTTGYESKALTSSADRFLIGIDDTGQLYSIEPVGLGHMIIQGETRSGKTAFTYWLLSQWAAAPDVLIAGCDPTGLLLRPFIGTIHEPWQVSGVSRVDVHIDLLRAVVAEMDGRIGCMPAHCDQIAPGESCPLIMLVLEEYAGLLRAASSKVDRDEIKRLVVRLLAEGHKAAIRVLIIVQRADADIIGGFERAQCSIRLSFRVDNGDAVVMLHPHARDQAELHCTAPPGIALFSAPGRRLARLRVPYLGEPLYRRYSDLVTTRAMRP